MPDRRGSGDVLRRLAPAKVNLALHVTGRRPDGYHELETLVVFAEIGDVITIAPADVVGLSISGEFAAHAPAGPDNLAWRAASLLREASGTGEGAHIHLNKAIPAGAGLGGGSADAAAVLHALNEVWGARLDRHRLSEMALRLGADVPMCLHGRALLARGIGEAVSPVHGLPPVPLVIVWPAVSLSTGEVFAALELSGNPPLPRQPDRFAGAAGLAAWLAGCRNDLEAPAIRLAPAVGEVLQALRAQPRCLLARMSGAGSACFGVFDEAAAAEAAAAEIAAARPGWWVRATMAG